MPLKGIPSVISPDLLRALALMGHGDEIVLADAYFPSHSLAQDSNCMVIRADGIGIPLLLDAILRLIELDAYIYAPVTLMEVVEQDRRKGFKNPPVWTTYNQILQDRCNKTVPVAYLERFNFYERARKAFIIVVSGETSQYGNIILKNGLVLDERTEMVTENTVETLTLFANPNFEDSSNPSGIGFVDGRPITSSDED